MYFRWFFILIFIPLELFAQNGFSLSDSTFSDNEVETIVDRINKSEPGKGTVRIIQDDSVTDRLGRPGKVNGDFNSGYAKYIEISGWRIQVFSGNNPRVSKNEAFSKEADIKSIFPDLGTYVTYTAPFWRLKVGDFQTYQDARTVLTSLRNNFPAFGREMSIIKEKIQIKQE